MSLLDQLAQFSLDLVQSLGYTGLFFLMVAESMVLPVPSEFVLPPAGWLAFQGHMSLWLAFAIATLGTIAGSLLSYAMGAYGLRPLLERYGKYVLVSKHHIDSAHAFFDRRGGATTIFLARFVPVVRHLISIPAGSARMKLSHFVAATALGGACWNLILLVAGYKLGENWRAVSDAVDRTKWWILAGAIVGVALVIAIRWRRTRSVDRSA